jgi:hypothetical protein
MKITKRNMNPATAAPAPAMPRPMVNDIAAPKVQVQPVTTATPAPQPATAQNFTTNLVTNIPIHNPQQAASVNEDAELDKIMQDVGHELKKEEHQKKPGHFSLFSRKKKTVVTVKPTLSAAVPSQAVATPQPVAAPAAAVPAQPTPASAAQAKTVPKAKHTSTAPVMTVIVTVVVTGLLMAAAVYSYK